MKLNLKERIKQKKGITLIALVVTIIILLILGGVTIATLTGDNGILKQTQNAKTKTTEGEEKEQIQLAYSEYQMAKASGELKPTLTVPGATADGDEILGWIITFEKTRHQYTLNSDGTIDNGVADRWDGETIEVPEISKFTWNIYNCAQFKFFAEFVNNGNALTEEQRTLVAEKGYNEDEITITEETQVNLMDNLDLGARANKEGEKLVGTEWVPIGTTSALKFIGTFEGNNHYVTGMYVNMDGNFGGIFGNSNTIKNLTIKNSYVKAANCSGGIVGALRSGTIENCHNINTTVIVTGYAIGGIVGQSTGTEIVNCSSSGTIESNGNGDNQIGGIVGRASSSSLTISNCSNTGTVTGEGDRVGGIVGITTASSTVSNCRNTGTVTGRGDWVGGILGIAKMDTTVSNCENTGTVTGHLYVGGVVGVNISSAVSQCSNFGTVTGYADLGGVVGVNSSSTVSQCSNSGTVAGYGQFGGVVGDNSSKSSVLNCYNIGDVSGTGNLGGCVGITWGNVEWCYNKGKIEGETLVGGVVGQIGANAATEVNIMNCYNTGEVEALGDKIGGIIGFVSQTGNSGKIENLYNSAKIIGGSTVGGIIGRNPPNFNINNCYNKGEVQGTVNVGALIGLQTTNTNNLSRMYYLNTINLLAIGNMDAPDTVKGVADDIKTFEEFLAWIESR